MNSATNPRNFAAKVFGRLLSAAFPFQQHVLTDLGPFTGLVWRCVCQELNTHDLTACGGCQKARLWTKDVTPPREGYGTLLEDLRAALTEWFDNRPQVRRPAAISFRVTNNYDDGPAWDTMGATVYFTDSSAGEAYKPNFDGSYVSEALVELGDFDQPQVGDVLRVVIPSPFTDPARSERSSEYPYTVSEYAVEAASVLGNGWGSESGYIGAYGKLWNPDGPTFRVFVDEYDDLVVALHDNPDGKRITVDLRNGAPSLPYELRAVGENIAAIIRANFS